MEWTISRELQYGKLQNNNSTKRQYLNPYSNIVAYYMKGMVYYTRYTLRTISTVVGVQIHHLHLLDHTKQDILPEPQSLN